MQAYELGVCELQVCGLQAKQYATYRLQLDQSVSCELWVNHQCVSYKFRESGQSTRQQVRQSKSNTVNITYFNIQ